MGLLYLQAKFSLGPKWNQIGHMSAFHCSRSRLMPRHAEVQMMV